jgi:hypothetical protein
LLTLYHLLEFRALPLMDRLAGHVHHCFRGDHGGWLIALSHLRKDNIRTRRKMIFHMSCRLRKRKKEKETQ